FSKSLEKQELRGCRKWPTAAGVLPLWVTGRRNGPMKALRKLFLMGIAIGATGLSAKAQAQQPEDDRPPVISRDTMAGTAPTAAPTQPADGSRHGLPLEAFAVVPGTRVLVRL